MMNANLPKGMVIAARFEIMHAAGSGGMGTVYRALDLLTSEWVAIKVLHRTTTGLEARRFAREARILSALRHPGIVSYVASGQTAEGLPYLAMEWLDGEDLAQRLERGPLSVLECKQLLVRVAESLACAHQVGIVHRDRTHKHKIRRRTCAKALHRRQMDGPLTHLRTHLFA